MTAGYPCRHICHHWSCWLAVLMLFCQPLKAELILGIHPYLESKELKQRFQPFADYLSKHLQEKVHIRVGKDYESNINAIGQGQIDIAFMGPAAYIELANEYGQRPLLARLVADDRPTFRGHIVVPETSTIHTLADLKNKVFAFGDPHSTMSRLVPQAMMQQAGVPLHALKAHSNYPGQGNVALAVLAGDADAGAVKEEIYRKYRPQGLRSIAVSPPISEHLFVARANLGKSRETRIREILLDLYGWRQVESILRPIKSNLTRLGPVHDYDFNGLRKLLKTLPE